MASSLPSGTASDFDAIVEQALGTEEPRQSFMRASRGRGPADAARRDPFDRMFDTEAGSAAANRIGSEHLTLSLVGEFGAELMMAMLGDDGGRSRRILVRAPDGRPTVLVLDPDVPRGGSRRITDTIEVTPDRIARIADTLDLPDESTALRAVAETMLKHGPEGVLDALWIGQPEIVLARRPAMQPLRVPDPCMRLSRGYHVSTAGIYCRDAAGTLGLSACLHGTGPVGTTVILGDGHETEVALADAVQDLVFLPLPPGCPHPDPGQALSLAGGAPGQGDEAEFDGVTTGRTSTRVLGHDIGLLRRRPTVQLRVQTAPDSNPGDSGSALLRNGELLGFAFEVTAPGDFPQFSDWIWASNALAALGLAPA